jgi:nucleotide-binding universal stress UspA family protein
MFKRILLPHDGSDLSKKAVRKGVEFAQSIGATVVGFFSPEDYQVTLYSEYVPPNLISKKEFEAQAKRTAEKYLDYVKKMAAAAAVPCETYYVTSVTPWEAIVDAAKKKKCDLILMASHGRRGLSGLLLGSQTQRVLTHSKIPVLVCR